MGLRVLRSGTQPCSPVDAPVSSAEVRLFRLRTEAHARPALRPAQQWEETLGGRRQSAPWPRRSALPETDRLGAPMKHSLRKLAVPAAAVAVAAVATGGTAAGLRPRLHPARWHTSKSSTPSLGRCSPTGAATRCTCSR